MIPQKNHFHNALKTSGGQMSCENKIINNWKEDTWGEQFVYLDILQTDKWLTPYLDMFLDVLGLDSSEDVPLTDELDVLGYSSSSSLKSLGSFLIFFAFLLLQIFIVTLFFWCRQGLCARYRQKIFWNGILGFFMQQSQTLTLSAAIGLTNEN